jgi:hypothetical protein
VKEHEDDEDGGDEDGNHEAVAAAVGLGVVVVFREAWHHGSSWV